MEAAMSKMIVEDTMREASSNRSDTPFMLVSLRPENTIATALHKLHGYKLTCAPVMEEQTAKAFRSARLLHLQDLALYLLETDGRADMFNTRVEHLPPKGLCGDMPGVPYVVSDATFVSAVRALKQHRRLVVLDQATDRPVGMLSPIDVVRWVLAHLRDVPAEVMAKPVSELKCTKGVITAKRSESMEQALRKFVGKEKSGIGVVDDQGRLVNNLSLADLRCLTPENAHQLLHLNVGTFLSETRKVPKEPVTCRPNTPFVEVLRLLHRHKIHRAGDTLEVFVVNEVEQPIAVFSATDAIINLDV